MDFVREMEEQLRKYPRQKIALVNMEKEMANYRRALPRIGPILEDGLPRSGSQEAAYVGRVVKLDALERCYELTRQDVEYIEGVLHYLTAEERRFIQAFYFQEPRRSAIDIAEDLGLARRSLYRMRGDVLRKLCHLRYGRCEL